MYNLSRVLSIITMVIKKTCFYFFNLLQKYILLYVQLENEHIQQDQILLKK